LTQSETNDCLAKEGEDDQVQIILRTKSDVARTRQFNLTLRRSLKTVQNAFIIFERIRY